MENRRIGFTCRFCGKRKEPTSGEPPCEVLEGWLTVAHWKGLGDVEHYSFCSLSCLKSWVDAHLPGVPKVFLESFGEEAE